jgi:hypothetical protein
MKLVAWLLWALAAIWVVLGIFGALEFQEFYGETSGLQVLALVLVVALVPGLVGWWAYRRSRSRLE